MKWISALQRSRLDPSLLAWARRSTIALRLCVLGVIGALSLGLAAAGCAARGQVSGSLRAQSLGGSAVVLPGRYVLAHFAHDEDVMTSFMLSDVPIDALRSGNVVNAQMLHIELLWLPRPGVTPMDSSAANASIRYVVVANGEIGIYGGTGFVLPAGALDARSVGVSLRNGSIQLQDFSAGFVDRLSPGQIVGNFTARRDDRATRTMHLALSQLVTNALGRTRFVSSDNAESKKAKS